ncbi:hypothetical protein RHRU231_450025 [Rhodococcus ruber]|uniref:Uncharacterized protein n=1 Tax=Rhodococcus ruber TaxID=1830 RepID=A0A098BJH9_9NOCA|nr:hypothetical protein RHRU231_450025 [Rhodococcus ruber]
MMSPAIFFFFGGISIPSFLLGVVLAYCYRKFEWVGPSDLRHLVEGQLHRGLTTEDRHQDLELLLLGVDLADRRRQRRERPVHDGDGLADLEVHLDGGLGSRRSAFGGTGRGGGLLLRLLRQEELHDLLDRQRRRARGGTHESGDAGGVAHRAPRFVVQFHPHQDVARQDLAVDLLALAVLDLGDLFGGHLDLEDVLPEVQVLHAGLEVGLDLVLVTGVGVHDVPVAGLEPKLLLEGLRGIDLLGRGLRGRLGLVTGRLVGFDARLCRLVGRFPVRLVGRFPCRLVGRVHGHGVVDKDLVRNALFGRGLVGVVLGGAHRALSSRRSHLPAR